MVPAQGKLLTCEECALRGSVCATITVTTEASSTNGLFECSNCVAVWKISPVAAARLEIADDLKGKSAAKED